MLMFDRIAEQLRQVEQELCSIQLSLSGGSTHANRDRQASRHVEGQLEQAILGLRDSATKLGLVNETYSQLHEELPLDNLIELAMDLVWQKTPISFVALILGDAELGPYHYHGMKGIQDSWRYIKKECIFTLSGVLARALLQRLDPNEPDYLYIPDMEAHGRPLPDEFPWMSCKGSLLIIPLRSENLARGALLLGHSQTHRFDEVMLRDEYVDIASNIAIAICNAQMRQELTKNVEQLINVQLLTREITHAQHYQDVTDILTKKIPEVIGKVDVQVFMQHPVQMEHRIKFVEDMPQFAGDSETLVWHHSPDKVFYSTSLSKNGTLSSILSSRNSQNSAIDLPATKESWSAITPEIRQLFQWTMKAGEPVFYDLEHLAENPEHPYCSDSGRALIVPIIGHSCTYGVIHIISLSPLRRFEESDMVVLRTIANSAATAIGRVELIQTREQAEIDATYKLICSLEGSPHESPCHSQRVVHNAVLLAQQLGLSPAEYRLIGRGAALHHLSMLTARDTDHQRYHSLSSSNTCPTVDPHTLQTLRVNPAVMHMLALVNATHAQHQQQSVNCAGSTNGRSSHRIYQQVHPQMRSTQEHASLTEACSDSPCLQSANEASFALTHFDISQLGACIIYMVDAIDHICADAVARQCDAPAELLEYLSANTGTLFEAAVAATAKDLLKRKLFLLPAGRLQTMTI